MKGVDDLVFAVRVDGLTVVLVCQAGVVTKAANGIGDIRLASNTNTLARVDRLEERELLRVTLDQVGQLEDDCRISLTHTSCERLTGSTVCSWDVKTPSCLERLASSLDSSVDILFGTVGEVE